MSEKKKFTTKSIKWLWADLTESPIVIYTKFHANMMVLAFTTDEGVINLLHSSPKSIRVNIDEHLDVLEAVVKPEME